MCVNHLWQVSLDITGKETQLLATVGTQEILRARFWDLPVHRQALIQILEGLALWSGERLYVVIHAAELVHPLLGLGRDGDEWPGDNPLLEYLFVERRACDSSPHDDDDQERPQ